MLLLYFLSTITSTWIGFSVDTTHLTTITIFVFLQMMYISSSYFGKNCTYDMWLQTTLYFMRYEDTFWGCFWWQSPWLDFHQKRLLLPLSVFYTLWDSAVVVVVVSEMQASRYSKNNHIVIIRGASDEHSWHSCTGRGVCWVPALTCRRTYPLLPTGFTYISLYVYTGNRA